MTMKPSDLAKSRGLKINNKLNAAANPAQFGAATQGADKREQRQQERALGVVPFACKLPIALVKQLQERGAAHEGGLNGLMTELVSQALAEK
ncbi:MAG TPA: hypothetical protein PK620_10420 [Denitromonas sp.]|uniref:hypothetical protein n=1 Tax=Denitromonas sp. TaxID=2734609 RepID=UPI001D540A8E|nr:hypothetical protein [Rhodocyclaceae bacterium]MCP5222456.1 hypothetical protein [Zoogloeaceae bacterium]HPR08594.1 hypothetical protein [Denitromonas sp.]HQU89022.1 hypothetical protein [Denitromonas sp.]HQV15321.1 hypothetical protein [Denitromonas sp.]